MRMKHASKLGNPYLHSQAGTEFATRLEACMILIQPLVKGAPHMFRAAIESWAHALTSSWCIFCGINQWLLELITHWLSSVVTQKFQTIMVPFLFDTCQARSMHWCFNLQVPRHDEVFFQYSYARFESSNILPRMNSTVLRQQSRVALSFKYPCITLQVASTQKAIPLFTNRNCKLAFQNASDDR